MRDASRVGKIGRRVSAARASVAEADRAGHGVTDADREHQSRTACEAPMQVRHAAARGIGRRILQDGAAQRGLPGAYDLRHRTVEVTAPDVIHALQRTQQSVSGRTGVCRRDTDDRAAGHHEHDGKISELGDGAPRNPLNGPVRKPAGGRDRRNGSNPLVHLMATST